MAGSSPGSAQIPARLGPIRLAPGVAAINAASYLFAAFAGICLTTSISAVLPYILNVNLGIPQTAQGSVSGNMGVIREIVLLALSSLIGALSDRTGRRILMVAGLAFLAAGYACYGFVGTITQLVLLQFLFAFGIALVNVIVIAIQVDYPEERSRGKLVGFTGVAIGLGSMLIGLVILRLPSWFAATGADDLAAGRYAMLALAGFALVALAVSALGLKGGPPPYADPKPNLRDQVRTGFTAARTNPRIMLAYWCAFVGRGDLIVIGTFFNLWLMQAGLARGLAPDEAAKTAGLYFALIMGIALLWAPIMGWLNDRIDRTTAMAGALAAAALGYLLTGTLQDPLGPMMYVAAVLLGVGQMSVVSASQTLIGQEAPREIRGAITGLFALCGAAGILSVSWFGGQIFDRVGPSAPFIGIGFLNALLCLYALRVRANAVLAAAGPA